MTSNLLLGNGLLILAVAIVSAYNAIYWWAATRGSWRDWPAGRSLMALLISLALMASTAAFTVLIRYDYPGKRFWYALLYTLVLISLIYVGHTIHAEIRKGRLRPPNQEEKHHGRQ